MRTHLLAAATLLATLAANAAENAPPPTKKIPVVDELHGVKITDEYRWLEDWSSPDVKAWSEAQNAYARSILDTLPGVDAIRARVEALVGAPTISYSGLDFAGAKLFAMKRQPPKQQPFLIVMASPDDAANARVLLDPQTLDAEGTTAIDWFRPSPDGSMVAVSLSKGGSESGDVHVFDTTSGLEVGDAVLRVNGGTAGGDLAWAPDSRGFYYTRYPRAGERPAQDLDFFMQVYFHALGQPADKDRYEIGKDFPRIAEVILDVDNATGRVIATVQNGDGGEFAMFLRNPASGGDGKWTQFADFHDKAVKAVFGPASAGAPGIAGDALYVVSRDGAPRGQILRLTTAAPNLKSAPVLIPQGSDTIVASFTARSILSTKDRLYVEYQTGGPSVIRAFGHDGKPKEAPGQLPVSSVGGMVAMHDDLLFTNSSFIDPPGVFRYSPAAGTTVKTALSTASPADFSDCEVIREFATSKDGAKVPINIIKRKTAPLDGKNPLLLTAYGGYGISLEPSFSVGRRVLAEKGFILCVANLRGGGEFGEEWHAAGNLTNKQNVFDDFYACAQHLIKQGYTNRDRMAIQGGSNGGLLMGAAFTQHPDLCKAVVSQVGIYDMLRVELSPNGAFNITEFGTVKNPDHFKALYAYSPYHHVKDGTPYPAILFTTGANDPRVDPMQSRKMTARLQAANASSSPILLRTTSKAGHGQGTALSETIAQLTDIDAFLCHELGVGFAPDQGRGAPAK